MVAAFGCLVGAVLGLISTPPRAEAPAGAERLADIRLTVDAPKAQFVLTADRQTMGVADRLHIVFSVTSPEETMITFPFFRESLGQFRIVEAKEIGPEIKEDGTQLVKHDLILETDEVGTLQIPSMLLTVHDLANAPGIACVLMHQCPRSARRAEYTVPGQLRTPVVDIEVTSIVPAAALVTEPRDIAGPIAIVPPPPPAPSSARGWMVAAAGAFVLLATAVYFWMRRRPKASAIPTSDHAAHDVALALLAQLEKRDLIGQRQIEAFHVALSDILRRYTDWRFDLRAPSRTTQEALAALSHVEGSPAQAQSRLSAVLSACDQVKFARDEPDASAMHKLFSLAKGFVTDTANSDVLAPPAAQH